MNNGALRGLKVCIPNQFRSGQNPEGRLGKAIKFPQGF